MVPLFRIVVFLITALTMIGMAGTASALLDESKYTETEKIGFAFHILGNLTPDYESWIKASNAYIKAKPPEKIYMLRDDSVRLQQGFLNYGPNEDLIRLQADVLIKVPLSNNQNDTASDYETIHVRLKDHDEFFFPVQVGPYWIALIPDQIEKIMTINLPRNDYLRFVENLGYSDGYRQEIPAIFEFKFRPLAVDVRTPVEFDNMALWPMLVEIGNATLWDQRKSVFVWQHQAAWYVPEKQKELIDLFGQ